MTLIGIETSTEYLSAALIHNDSVCLERHLKSGSSHCELLTGFILELTVEAGITPSDIEGIAVSMGPGSFTGLRIGIASAMGLAYGLGIKVAPVKTLTALASKIPTPGKLVCPLIDAKRSEVYTGLYRTSTGIPEQVLEPTAMSLTHLCDILPEQGEQVIITGPAAERFYDSLTTSCGSSISLASPDITNPDALSVAKLGLLMFQTGDTVEPGHLTPIYLRRSDAEILRDKK
ncbi:tRNA (adenosine(37)-N6)-threonylcarbamoyltransferase complex dimerization subunit type 1 TsaB [Candidatus Latescibacterota bacterium]